ncbi:hypothetical protein [Streptomyces sp. NPDC056661]|uniref:hypothetical protein n=1 Tax=Streptomyces sp. NPDC056661 TaxID=3345898 RepID=UPI0036CD5E9B
MSNKAVLVLLGCVLAVLIAALLGAAAGYLARRDEASYPRALSTAGAAFATTLVVMAAVVQAVMAVSAL